MYIIDMNQDGKAAQPQSVVSQTHQIQPTIRNQNVNTTAANTASLMGNSMLNLKQ